jgi:hypothetical protein
MIMFERKNKKGNNQEIKIKNPYSEIWIDLNDIELTKSFERFRLSSVDDQIFIHNGNIYFIDQKSVEPLIKYDPLMKILKPMQKIKRILSSRRLGFIDFILSDGTDNIIMPLTRENALKSIEIVKTTPMMLKGITENTKYAKFIRSLNNKKDGTNFEGKWLYIVLIVIAVLVVGLFVTGVITPEMLGVR